MILQVLFLVSFLAGLVMGVVFMLSGMERASRPAPGSVRAGDVDRWRTLMVDAQRHVRARMVLPGIGAFAIAFGAAGYLLTRYSDLSGLWQLSLAAVAGALAIVLLITLVALWVVPSARREAVDDRYLLQGHLARVTLRITAGQPGQIAYIVDGATFTAAAIGLDGTTAEPGTDVVIERIENGCAYVEPWSIVEKRL